MIRWDSCRTERKGYRGGVTKCLGVQVLESDRPETELCLPCLLAL